MDARASRLKLEVVDFRKDPKYVLYYINLGHLMITGIFPLISLIILNHLVYKHLVKRRRQVEELGKKNNYKRIRGKFLRLKHFFESYFVFNDMYFIFLIRMRWVFVAC